MGESFVSLPGRLLMYYRRRVLSRSQILLAWTICLIPPTTHDNGYTSISYRDTNHDKKGRDFCRTKMKPQIWSLASFYLLTFKLRTFLPGKIALVRCIWILVSGCYYVMSIIHVFEQQSSHVIHILRSCCKVVKGHLWTNLFYLILFFIRGDPCKYRSLASL